MSFGLSRAALGRHRVVGGCRGTVALAGLLMVERRSQTDDAAIFGRTFGRERADAAGCSGAQRRAFSSLI